MADAQRIFESEEQCGVDCMPVGVGKNYTVWVKRNKNEMSFIVATRKKYLESIARNNRSPDIAHNAILVKLLFDDFSEAKLKANKADPKHIFAYSKVRASEKASPSEKERKTGSPLYIVPKDIDFPEIPKKVDFFVRDFLQIQGEGGKSKPWVLGEMPKITKTREIIVSKQRNGLHITDGIRHSDFQKKFDEYVGKINDGIPDRENFLPKFKGIAHRDGIQLIPVEINKRVSQMAGAMMRNVIINGNTISSKGDFQGIFATDGAFQNLAITNNSIKVAGRHTISINGMLSGTIDGNTDLKGKPLLASKIELYPLRIGGDANIYIMGFKNRKGDPHHYAYETIKGSQVKKRGVRDLRRITPKTPHATYWTNVHMPTLQKLYNSLYPRLKKKVAQINSQWDRAKKQAKSPEEIRIINNKYRTKAEQVWGEMLMQAGGTPVKPNYK